MVGRVEPFGYQLEILDLFLVKPHRDPQLPALLCHLLTFLLHLASHVCYCRTLSDKVKCLFSGFVMRVRDLVEEYLHALEGEGKSWSKIGSQVKPLLRLLGDCKVADLRGAALDAYRCQRAIEKSNRGSPVSQSTINRELTYLRAALRRAYADERIDRVPVFRMRRELGERCDWWTDDQLKEILAFFRPRHPCLADLIEFYALTGWRKCEALRLRWDEVLIDRGVIRLAPRRVKERSERVLPIVGAVKVLLERRFEARKPGCPWVFHRDGQERKDFRRAWQTALKACGCSNLLHGLRRTMARRYLLAKCPIELIMKIGGWRSREMLERYARLETDDLAQAMLEVEKKKNSS
jgi:integrase